MFYDLREHLQIKSMQTADTFGKEKAMLLVRFLWFYASRKMHHPAVPPGPTYGVM